VNSHCNDVFLWRTSNKPCRHVTLFAFHLFQFERARPRLLIARSTLSRYRGCSLRFLPVRKSHYRNSAFTSVITIDLFMQAFAIKRKRDDVRCQMSNQQDDSQLLSVVAHNPDYFVRLRTRSNKIVTTKQEMANRCVSFENLIAICCLLDVSLSDRLNSIRSTIRFVGSSVLQDILSGSPTRYDSPAIFRTFHASYRERGTETVDNRDHVS